MSSYDSSVTRCPNLVLGTAQLGMAYGIANQTGQPGLEEAQRMLKAAWDGGVRAFDTAQAYGASESVLGGFIRTLDRPLEARVTTKLSAVTDISDPAALRQAIATSRERLGVETLWAVLLHLEEHLDAWSGALGNTLLELKAAGWIRHLGASVYSPEAARRVLGHRDLDVLEIPGNVFDRRAVRSGVVDIASRAGKKLLVRSLFLQGLVLMDPADAPLRIPHAASAISALRAFCATRHLQLRQFAFDYVAARFPGSQFVIGAETEAQIRANLELTQRKRLSADVSRSWDEAWPDDIIGLIDPTRWPH